MSNFEQYWGIKLLNALRALHDLYVARVDPQSDAGSDAPLAEDEDNSPTYDNSFFTRLQDLNEEEI